MHALLEERDAVSLLNEALTIAVPENYIRPFIDALPGLEAGLRGFAEKYPTFIGKVLRYVAHPQSQLVLDLSAREMELLELVVAGLSNQQIAEKLFISVGTTKWHLNNIYSKLGVSRRAEAIARAQQHSLIR